MTIKIKAKNKGKFNALKKRTGKTTAQLTHSKNSLTRKRAIFAQNARKWKHEDGGLVEYTTGGMIGGVGGVLGAIPTPFTQIAGAALGVVGGLIGSAEERKAAEIARVEQAVNRANSMQSSVTNPYTATFQRGGKVQDPTNIQNVRAGDFYKPLLQRADSTYYNTIFGQNKSSEEEAIVRNRGLLTALSDSEVGGKVWNFNKGEYMTRNLPPMDSTLSEMKNKVANLPQKDVDRLMKVDWYNKGIGITDIPKIYGAMKGSNTSLKDLNRYYQHMKGLMDQGYTYAQGGITNGIPNIEVEGDEVMQGPDGSMASIQGPSHAQGGIDVSAQPGTRVFSDKLKANTGRTFAQEADDIRKRMAKYEKMLSK